MTTTVSTAGRPAIGDSRALTWLTGWIRSHKQAAVYVAVAVVVALALFVWNFLSAKTAERSAGRQIAQGRSEEHTSELQSQSNLVCRLLLEKKKKNRSSVTHNRVERSEVC